MGNFHKLHPRRLEGGGASQLAYVMSKLGHNVEFDFRYGTVLEPLPSIKVKIDNSRLVFEDDDLIVLEHLRERTEEMVINGQTETVTVKSPLKQNDRVLVVIPDDPTASYWVIGKV